MCSGVWPGVWIASIWIFPTVKPVSVLQEVGVRSISRPLIQPIGTALPGKIEFNIRVLRKLPRATHKVGMDMRFRHCRDFQAVFVGDVPVKVDITLGIDQQGFARALTSDEIGVLGQIGIEDLSK